MIQRTLRRGRIHGIMIIAAGLILLFRPAYSMSEVTERLEGSIQSLLAGKAASVSDSTILVKLADLYLDLGDEQSDAAKRLAAYGEGARFARHAVQISPLLHTQRVVWLHRSAHRQDPGTGRPV